jgi:methylated-DNA-[protein]-cysteine S-methyltransferase
MDSYSHGHPEDFSDIDVSLEAATAFQRRVLDQCRRIAWGCTVTYAELASRAGWPGAARAVGNVMARNPVPLIIPCHRVVGAGNRLGGFSAPSGLVMKKRLLALEGAGVALS